MKIRTVSTHPGEDKTNRDMMGNPTTSRWEGLNHDQCPVPAETSRHRQRRQIRHLLGNATTTWVKAGTRTSANETSMVKVVITTNHTEDVIVTPHEVENTNPQGILRNTGITSTTRVDHTTTTRGIKVEQMKLGTRTSEGHRIDRHTGKEGHQLKDHNPAVQHPTNM